MQESRDRLSSVPAGSPDLVQQFVLAPWRSAARVPVSQQLECLLVSKREASDEATADSKRVHIPMLAGYRRRHPRQIAPRPLDWVKPHGTPVNSLRSNRRCHDLFNDWKVRRHVNAINRAVMDCDEMGRQVL